MDASQFQEAQRAYDAGDFRAAAKGFLSAAGKGSAGNGAAYHMAGNALMKLRRHTDAITVYGHALRDETYDRRGTVLANLGAAYSAQGDYVEAIRQYESALAEPDYDCPSKAWQGIAKAFMERGHVDEAAVAYRKAAIDPGNPEPGKALVNLGLCFMALGRPADAAEAYKAALGFDTYKARGKALSNLGQAYTAMGEYDEAVKAFEKAVQLHAHKLSPAAREAYEDARAHATPGALADPEEGGQPLFVPAPQTPVEPQAPAQPQAPAEPQPLVPPGTEVRYSSQDSSPFAPVSARQTVDGWESGQMPAALTDVPPGGWETTELAALTGAAAGFSEASAYAAPVEPEAAPSTYAQADQAASELGFGDESAVSDFFSRSEEDMKVKDREIRRQKRADNRTGLKTVIAIGVSVLVLAAALGALYWFGFGWPMQESTVTALLENYAAGRPVETYWVAVPDKDVAKEMAKVPPVKEFTLGGVVRGPNTSAVKVTVTPEQGTPLTYVVTLSREGVGWKVSGIDNDWRSTGGS